MNVLIDTNVSLDVLLKREPFFEYSQLVLLAAEQKYINGFISASSVTDIYYLVNKVYKDSTSVRKLLREHLIGIVGIAAVDSSIIIKALNAEWKDFEDCVQCTIGESIDADYIVTRNAKDFENMGIKIVTPKELLDIIAPE
jgi:predicted nucleic acid-binding protein